MKRLVTPTIARSPKVRKTLASFQHENFEQLHTVDFLFYDVINNIMNLLLSSFTSLEGREKYQKWMIFSSPSFNPCGLDSTSYYFQIRCLETKNRIFLFLVTKR